MLTGSHPFPEEGYGCLQHRINFAYQYTGVDRDFLFFVFAKPTKTLDPQTIADIPDDSWTKTDTVMLSRAGLKSRVLQTEPTKLNQKMLGVVAFERNGTRLGPDTTLLIHRSRERQDEHSDFKVRYNKMKIPQELHTPTHPYRYTGRGLLLNWNIDGLLRLLNYPEQRNQLLRLGHECAFIFLQETKLNADTSEKKLTPVLESLFPEYDLVFNSYNNTGKKLGYAGTGTLVHKGEKATIKNIKLVTEMGLQNQKTTIRTEMEQADGEARIHLTTTKTAGGTSRAFVNVYAVNAKDDLSRMDLKAVWYHIFGDWIRTLKDQFDQVLVVGDLNFLSSREPTSLHPKYNTVASLTTASTTDREIEIGQSFARRAQLTWVQRHILGYAYTFLPTKKEVYRYYPRGFNLDFAGTWNMTDLALFIAKGFWFDHQPIVIFKHETDYATAEHFRTIGTALRPLQLKQPQHQDSTT